jgi:hypothetical protein
VALPPASWLALTVSSLQLATVPPRAARSFFGLHNSTQVIEASLSRRSPITLHPSFCLLPISLHSLSHWPGAQDALIHFFCVTIHCSNTTVFLC